MTTYRGSSKRSTVGRKKGGSEYLFSPYLTEGRKSRVGEGKRNRLLKEFKINSSLFDPSEQGEIPLCEADFFGIGGVLESA